jgi:3-deoxy-D-manno-octulosonate 8-phosphate phosphatase (KDO 8-P phosphatase)
VVNINEFKKNGGEFLTNINSLKKKIKNIRAFVFDWDGVFNNSSKGGKGESYFTEVDSMGTNLMRFSNWLKNEQKNPVCGIISGEVTDTAIYFIERERFHSGYFKAKDKIKAWDNFKKTHQLKSEQVAFFYDDVLDLPIAKEAGISICMRRQSNPVLNAYIRKNKLADYITGSTCGNFALREACELMIFLHGNGEQVLNERVSYSETYSKFITTRNAVHPSINNLKEN